MRNGLWKNPVSAATLAASALAVLLVAGCGNGPQQMAQLPVPVLVDTVRVRDIPYEIRTIGSVEAFNTVEINARVGGAVEKVYFEEGSDVRAGDMLFLIDPAPYRATLESARAKLVRDSVSWENARETVRRNSGLLDKEYITPQQFDDLVAQEKSLEATVRSDRADYDNARLELGYCSIRSPIDGRTGRRMVDPGNIVRANADDPLVVIHQLRPIYVSFTVPERYLNEILGASKESSLPVHSYAPVDGRVTHTGSLSFVDNKVDAATGTVSLKATFANEDESLWPGQFVNTIMELKTLKNSTVVPSRAVQSGQQGHFVFIVLDDMTVESRNVSVTYERDNLSIIPEGLHEGEVVVVDGQLRLKPGSVVTVKKGLGIEDETGEGTQTR